ncbi:MAG: glycosyltransferase family 9 protein [Bacteroidetes bacterium]|nr:glycosyltransferase family 9 protein [Bacteroidota bacterium]
MKPENILIIRFSSIGDIVLTSPVVRCIKQQKPNANVYFVTKKRFSVCVENNNYLKSVFTFDTSINEIIGELKKINFDIIIDLHNNIRSRKLAFLLGKKAIKFNKINTLKFFSVLLKSKKILPKTHIVDRFFDALKPIGVVNDGLGLDFFIAPNNEINVTTTFNFNDYYVLVAGGSYYTKQIPINKLNEICLLSNKPIIVLGGKEDAEIGAILEKNFSSKVISACGKFNLAQSASIIKQASVVITSDTGLMHIASALKKPIASFWGNTIPEFGMSPYKPNSHNKIFEVNNLNCRPCSKLGYKKCPKKHFNCMNTIDVSPLKKMFEK